jgi:putative hydrolase of the HAD superfamily
MTIFFDLDDTLIDSEAAHILAIGRIWQDHFRGNTAPEHLGQQWITITDKYLKMYFENQLSLEEQRIHRIIDLWGVYRRKITHEEAQTIYNQYHEHFLNSCLCFSDTISALEKLKHFSLGIISNGSYEDQIHKLKRNGLLQYFDVIVISESVGVSKPDKEIFRMACQKAKSNLSDCIYIGNSYELDYLGSLNSGMKAIWLDRNSSDNSPNAERIESLDELGNHPFICFGRECNLTGVP